MGLREQTSNNRVKSGAAYANPRSSTTPDPALNSSTNSHFSDSLSPTLGYPIHATTRLARPINTVPGAGTKEGLPNGMEVTTPSISIGEQDLESGHLSMGDGHEEATLSPPTSAMRLSPSPIRGGEGGGSKMSTPRIVTTSPPPMNLEAEVVSVSSGSGSGNGTSEWSVITGAGSAGSSVERKGSKDGDGGEILTNSTTSERTLVSPPERPISALEL